MLAEKVAIERVEGKTQTIRPAYKKWFDKIKRLDPEDFVGNLSDILFKGVLFFGIPYFIFVLIKFIAL